MKELDNFLEANEIDKEYHSAVFESEVLENLYSKVNFKNFDIIRNQIYWLSLLIYRIAFTNYIKSINSDTDSSTNSLKLNKNNIIVFHPICNITSELCRQFKNNSIYPSNISLLCRQIIEQICLIKEIENEKVNEKEILEATIESYNRQIRAASINAKELNSRNKGLLKVFKNKISYGNLAKKYNYGFMYNFFSGDIHTLSQVNKLMPFYTKYDEHYYNIYFNCVLSLLHELVTLLEPFNKAAKVDLSILNKIEFIDIKSNKK